MALFLSLTYERARGFVRGFATAVQNKINLSSSSSSSSSDSGVAKRPLGVRLVHLGRVDDEERHAVRSHDVARELVVREEHSVCAGQVRRACAASSRVQEDDEKCARASGDTQTNFRRERPLSFFSFSRERERER